MTEEVEVAKEPTSNESGFKAQWRKFAKRFPMDLIPLGVLLATVFLVILYASDWKFWDGQQSIETTNDAYLRADVTPLSTKVSGTVSSVLINDYDHVTKGQLLVELRNDDFIAREKQAEALYQQARQRVHTIGKQIDVQQQHIESARLGTSIGGQDVTRAVANVAGTNASLLAAKASLDESKSQKAHAQAQLKADEAVELRALQERDRQVGLFADKASTQQTIEQVTADYDRQKATVEADKAEIARLSSLILERAAEISKTTEDIKSSVALNASAGDQLKTRDVELVTERKQMEVLIDQLKEAQSEAAAQLAALNVAKVDLDYTKIIAPVDGALSERRVRAGQQVNAGTQVVTIVSSIPWVIASFRETQIRKMAVGDRAEISVDAFGGQKLEGKIQSMSPASEAQFALLPPDNPSGNFTKITQRLPVKIVLDAKQQGLERLRPGLTVIAKVWPHL
jgi:membrane fusion protein (multidrug efflux system)